MVGTVAALYKCSVEGRCQGGVVWNQGCALTAFLLETKRFGDGAGHGGTWLIPVLGCLKQEARKCETWLHSKFQREPTRLHSETLSK